MTCYNFVWTYDCIQLDISGIFSLLVTCIIIGYFYPPITLLIRVQLVEVLFVSHVETYKLQRAKNSHTVIFLLVL